LPARQSWWLVESSALRSAIGLGLALVAISTAALGYMYRAATAAQIEAVRVELTQIANIAASLVDGDLHRQIVSPAQQGSAEYVRALDPLLRLHKASRDLIYVYTAILRDGQIYFVLGTDSVYRVPGDELPADPIMGRYEGRDPFFRQALEEQRQLTHPSPVREVVRTYLSAFAPIHDSKGEFVGVVGVDMWTARLDDRLAHTRATALSAWLALLVLAVLAAVLRYQVRAARAPTRRKASFWPS
jgi:hypothetical protein